jgi:hypothetical protein
MKCIQRRIEGIPLGYRLNQWLAVTMSKQQNLMQIAALLIDRIYLINYGCNECVHSVVFSCSLGNNAMFVKTDQLAFPMGDWVTS